jgi:shikimate kinase
MGHIWLVGMMGSGKTTVGVLAAQLLGRPFVDTDASVVTNTGRTIPDLFAIGESAFRAAESEAITAAAENADSVIATGGGSILSEDNVTIMRASGSLVLLDVDAQTIRDRIDFSTSRPLLQSADSVDLLLAERADAYNTVAQHIVPTVGRVPGEIAMEVASCVDT